jgi:hypothetical protein
MNKTPTAVEWLENQIVANKRMFGTLPTEKGLINLIEQAKKIEDAQRKEMYLSGIENYDPTFNNKIQQ